MTGTMGLEDFVAWDGGCLFIGKATGVMAVHSHYAIQVAFGDAPGIRFRADDDSPWVEYEGAMIASRQPHTMDATWVPYNAVLFVEPETAEGRGLAKRCADAGIIALSTGAFQECASSLFDTWRRHGNTAPIISAAKEVVSSLLDGTPAWPVSDDRIQAATTYINSHLDGPLTLEEVAEAVHLSPSRFRHLFVEQTGTTMRAYILWRRFLHAWKTVADGGSLSAAAHSAGFADAAHLTRTSQRTFGFAPSTLLINRRGQRFPSDLAHSRTQ